jgi:putative restriction endonuclease
MKNDSQEINSLLNLRADRSHGWDESTRGQAPHKPFLLLSILDGIEQGWIIDNRIELSQNLVDTFFTYWNAVMGEDKVTTIGLPFFYMKSEPFWELSYKAGEKKYKNSPSLGGLKKRVEYAVIDPGLFDLMQSPSERDNIRKLLAEHYFSNETADRVLEISGFNRQAMEYTNEVVEMAAEPFVPFQKDNKKRKLVTRYAQVREVGFSTAVRKQYDYHCAICRERLVTPGGESLVEGAHIIPWSKSNNDDPRNGLSLCRSHHWMFDKMMLTIRDDYSIKLSGWLAKNGNKMEDTMKLKNNEILLPENDRFYPSELALQDHAERFKEYHAKN